MRPVHPLSQAGLAVVVIAILAACATPGTSTDGPAAEAPSLRTGDRWVYQVTDGFLDAISWQETHQVTDAGPAGLTLRVTRNGPRVDTDRVEQWSAPGTVVRGALFDGETRQFSPPLTRFSFPLRPGRTWNEWVGSLELSTRQSGDINRWVRVGNWEEIRVPAGTFPAIRLTVLTRLDDEDPWRNATRCSYTVWYAPAVRGIVREEREAMYTEKGSGPNPTLIRSQHAVYELASFTEGAR